MFPSKFAQRRPNSGANFLFQHRERRFDHDISMLSRPASFKGAMRKVLVRTEFRKSVKPKQFNGRKTTPHAANDGRPTVSIVQDSDSHRGSPPQRRSSSCFNLDVVYSPVFEAFLTFPFCVAHLIREVFLTKLAINSSQQCKPQKLSCFFLVPTVGHVVCTFRRTLAPTSW